LRVRFPRGRSKKFPRPTGISYEFLLANPDPGCCGLYRFIAAPPAVPTIWMILIAIFSVIVLLLCWLCYHSDVNN
jgi:hypothetical protein